MSCRMALLFVARPCAALHIAAPARPTLMKMAQEVPASEMPGTYVKPYSMALGVSTAAVLCSELVPRVSATAMAAAPFWLGRAASCTGLPLVIASFLVLVDASHVGPDQLRSDVCQRLNLALALTSIIAVVTSPRPDVSVIIARSGSALLCLEVWSQVCARRAPSESL